jgi:hypothetical protein
MPEVERCVSVPHGRSMTTQIELPVGPFTWPEAHSLGLSRRDIDEQLVTRRLRRVLHNVYVDASLPDTVELRIAAATRVVTDGAVLCDRTAAWLLGVDVFEYRELEILPPLEMVVLPERHRVERRGCAGGERDLAPYDIMALSSLRVTTPLRTALDLGCSLPRGRAIAALDMFMRLHGLTRPMLDMSLPRYRGRRGVVQLRELVTLADPRAESPRESRVRLAIHDDDLPAPELQWWVAEAGVLKYRLDIAYPKHRVAIEYDGEEFHDRTAEQQDADSERREWLRSRGWTVIVVKRGGLGLGSRKVWLHQLRVELGLR